MYAAQIDVCAIKTYNDEKLSIINMLNTCYYYNTVGGWKRKIDNGR